MEVNMDSRIRISQSGIMSNEDPTKKIGAVKNRHSPMNKVVWFKGYKGWMRYPMNNYILSHCGILSRLIL